MAEQQLVDYIKKAKDTGQTDDQTRNLLYKNGWTEAEVSDAFALLGQSQPKTKPEFQAQTQVQPQTGAGQPEIEVRSQVMNQSQPQTQPQYKPRVQPQIIQSDTPSIKGRSHLVTKLLMVLLVLFIIGGAGYFIAGQYFNFSWNSFGRPNAETVISNMLNNMKNVKSSQTTTQMNFIATDMNTKASQGELIFNTNTETDTSDINNLKSNGNITINLTVPGSSSPSVLSSVSMSTIGGVSYFKINSITIPDTFSYSGLDVSKITGNWFKLDQDSIEVLSQAETGQVGILNTLPTNSSDLAKKIQGLILTENMFSVDKQLNDEVINGQNAYHYSVKISQAKIGDLLNNIINLQTQSSGSTVDSSGLLVQNLVQAFINTFVQAIGDVNLEIWIGKKDYMLYRVKVEKTIDLSRAIPSASTQLEVKINLNNSSFNKPITVQAPEDAQKIESIILPLLKTQTINSYMNQIGFIAQSVFYVNNSYYSLCSRGLLNGYLATYGTDLIKLNNDIISEGATKPVCLSSVQNYCISTQLSDGSFVCVGKNNNLGTTRCISAATVCQ